MKTHHFIIQQLRQIFTWELASLQSLWEEVAAKMWKFEF